MARRRRKALSGNLDSLLDTMMSVVGILIIILIVIQIGVKEKIKELTLEEEVREISVAEVDEKKETLLNIKQQIDKKEKDFSSKNKAHAANLAMIKKLRQEHATESKLLAAANNPKADPAKIHQEISKTLKVINAAEAQKKALNINQSKLKKILSAYKKKKKTKADSSVKLPNPRSVKPGSRPIIFICKKQRVLYRDDALYQKYFKSKIQLGRIKQNKLDEYDPTQLAKFFATRSKNAPFGKFEHYIHKTHAQFRLNLSTSTGESKNIVYSRSSRFQKKLKTVDKDKHYLVFLVHPDSYDIYLRARDIAAKLGYACGWQPLQGSEWDYILWTPNLFYGAKKYYEEQRKAQAKKPKVPAAPRESVID